MVRNSSILFFITIVIFFNLHDSHQCSPRQGVPEETEDTAIIEDSPYLKYLRDYTKIVSHEQTFNRRWFHYLKCNGTYDKDVGDVLRGLCSYCSTFREDNKSNQWECMNQCYTGVQFGECLHEYRKRSNGQVRFISSFVEKLSGSMPHYIGLHIMI
ncbi:uncharacterized protein LOC103574613 [Microplitis demolitor]|uniref:uncharacterized protein LOC103574613 n=1 Tax=Microplitis demolitor TaxID=69319 RepID=UPI0004CCA6CB|nr:uncharacterized protein LOC103574613 [Microplitis demolitor]